MKNIKKDTKKAINQLCKLLNRDCGKEWELALHHDTIYLSGGWKDDDVEIDGKLPLKG